MKRLILIAFLLISSTAASGVVYYVNQAGVTGDCPTDRPAGNGYDIGAYQYQGKSCVSISAPDRLRVVHFNGTFK